MRQEEEKEKNALVSMGVICGRKWAHFSSAASLVDAIVPLLISRRVIISDKNREMEFPFSSRLKVMLGEMKSRGAPSLGKFISAQFCSAILDF